MHSLTLLHTATAPPSVKARLTAAVVAVTVAEKQHGQPAEKESAPGLTHRLRHCKKELISKQAAVGCLLLPWRAHMSPGKQRHSLIDYTPPCCLNVEVHSHSQKRSQRGQQGSSSRRKSLQQQPTSQRRMRPSSLLRLLLSTSWSQQRARSLAPGLQVASQVKPWCARRWQMSVHSPTDDFFSSIYRPKVSAFLPPPPSFPPLTYHHRQQVGSSSLLSLSPHQARQTLRQATARRRLSASASGANYTNDRLT